MSLPFFSTQAQHIQQCGRGPIAYSFYLHHFALHALERLRLLIYVVSNEPLT
jgi:hypothetical protein